MAIIRLHDVMRSRRMSRLVACGSLLRTLFPMHSAYLRVHKVHRAPCPRNETTPQRTERLEKCAQYDTLARPVFSLLREQLQDGPAHRPHTAEPIARYRDLRG